MKISRPVRRFSWLGLALALLGGALQSQAQTGKLSVGSPPKVNAPASTSASTAGPGAAATPTSTTSPSQLPARSPTGLSLPNARPPEGSPTAINAPPPKTLTVEPADPAAQPNLPAGRGARYVQVDAATGSPPGPYTALQISQSFLAADTNRDGELTPEEAERLTLLPYAFEDMDRNRDRILSRSEYDDSLRLGPQGR